MEWYLTNYGSKLRRHQHVIHVRHMLCTIFVHKTPCQKYFFQILSPKNAQTVNLKNPDLYSIRGIHPKRGLSGFMIRVWIPETKNPVLDQEIRIRIFQQKLTHDFSLFQPARKWINLLKREAWLRLSMFSLCFKSIKHENKTWELLILLACFTLNLVNLTIWHGKIAKK